MRRTVLACVAALGLSSGPALSEGFTGFGGFFVPDPGRFQVDLEGGYSRPQFSRFKYGDVRASFPSVAPVLSEALNDRGRDHAYNAGGRISYGLGPMFGAPMDVYGRFQHYRATRDVFHSELNATNAVFVPYIDGQVRPTLGGGAVVGLFTNSAQELRRSLTSYEGEIGVRQHYVMNGMVVSPGVFFAYQRLEQRDRLSTSLNTDPPAHTLNADINSDHYRFGGTIRGTMPVFVQNLFLVVSANGGVDIVHARYNGSQTFGPSGTFNLPNEQFASASDSRTRIGGFVGGEAGFTWVLFPGAAVSLLGNVRYLTTVPRVIYPTPINGTITVDGPARLGFNGQLNYGGTVTFIIKM